MKSSTAKPWTTPSGGSIPRWPPLSIIPCRRPPASSAATASASARWGRSAQRPARFQGREWEFKKVPTTCSYCGVGCTLVLNVKDNQVLKVTSDEDLGVNRGWTCVKGRFGFDYVHSPDRLTEPLIREGNQLRPASWDEALNRVAEGLKKVKDEVRPRRHRRPGLGQVHQRGKLSPAEAGPRGPGHQQRGPLRPSLTQLHGRRSGDGFWQRSDDQLHRGDSEARTASS